MFFRRKPKDGASRRKSSDGKPETGRIIPRTRLPVDMLETGMRVVKLDRPWTQVPVLFQGFIIDTPAQIQTLRHYCHWVMVEGDEKTIAVLQARVSDLHRRLSEPLPEFRSLVKELPRARTAYLGSQAFVDRILYDIEHSRELDLREARPLIQGCVKSIQANANAMFWLARIKSQDAYTAEHCLRVAVYAIAFGRFLGMPEEDLTVIGLCGLLHDIGKLKIDPAILHKPGALTDEEMCKMRRHAEFGYQLLQSQHTLEPIVGDVTRHHHERMDGRGYPYQLQEWQISRFARLIAIVDAFDALTSDRCYREGVPTSEALRILYRGRGVQFDAEMIEAFIRMVGVYPAGTLVELNTGEVALVIASHPGKKLKPRVELLLDADKRARTPYIVDLADTPLDAGGIPYSIRQPLPDGAYGVSLEGRINGVINESRVG
ncbi:HD-GYP domain-containing protein [Marinobacter sp.]|uniref:HD-GYP domain-containing protein n=1 Tax=Marinobacter sp. TaxID=50741 RepID=UPI0038510153